MNHRKVWDEQYSKKGTMWRGVAELPFDIYKTDKVLELGCGNGKTIASLAQRSSMAVGLDHSLPGLLECSKNVESVGGLLVLGDVRSIPFRDEAFDVVVCIHMMEHLFQKERMESASEMCRVLKDGGKLIFQSFSVKDMRFGKGDLVEKNTFIRGDGIIYHYFEDEDISGLFSRLELVSLVHRTLQKRYHGQNLIRDVVQAELVKRQ